MKTKQIIVVTTITILLSALGLYLLNGCQKNVESIGDTPLDINIQFDYSNVFWFENLVELSIENNDIHSFVEEIIQTTKNLISTEDSIMLSKINFEEVFNFLENNYVITDSELEQIDQGNIDVETQIINRIQSIPTAINTKEFKSFIKKLYSNDIYKNILPQLEINGFIQTIDFDTQLEWDIINTSNLKSSTYAGCINKCKIKKNNDKKDLIGDVYVYGTGSGVTTIGAIIGGAKIGGGIGSLGGPLGTVIGGGVGCLVGLGSLYLAYKAINAKKKLIEKDYKLCIANCKIKHKGGS